MRPLKQRLQALKGTATPASSANAQGLALRIERLRTGARLSARSEPRAPGDEALAQCLSARRLRPGLLLCESRLPIGSFHGETRLVPQPIRALNALPGESIDPEHCVFLDTETTGLSGGSGTVVFQIGLARYRSGMLRIKQFVISGFAAERAMLEQLAGEFEGKETLVSYNGKSFDLPLLATRFRLHEQANPLTGLPHLDLLHPMRRRFGKHWENCRLASVERCLLGFSRSHDLPGSQAPKAWLDYVRQGFWRPLAGVLQHNRLDLLSLAAALPALDRAISRAQEEGACVQAPSPKTAAPVSASDGRRRLDQLRRLLRA
jgi:hypothetical protein